MKDHGKFGKNDTEEIRGCGALKKKKTKKKKKSNNNNKKDRGKRRKYGYGVENEEQK